MEQMARAVAGVPRLLLRALVICFLAALWLLMSESAADASGRDDAPGLSVAQAVHDTVASTRDTAQDSRHAAESAAEPVTEPAADAARDVQEAGRRATEEAVRTVEAVARETAETADDTIDDTAERVRAVAQEATRQVAEVVESPEQVVAPRPAPARPALDGRHTTDRAPASQLVVDVRESLVTQEDPAFLAPPVTPVQDLVRAAAQTTDSTLVDELTSPEPAPSPGAAPADAPPAHGGSGQQVPTPTQAAYVGDVVPAADLMLVTGAVERALDPPAERATSPGTTPD